MLLKLIPMPFFFLLLFLNKVYSQDFNFKNLNKQYNTVSAICSINNGTVDTSYNSQTFEQTYTFVNGFKFASHKHWYKGLSNSFNLPYVIQQPSRNTAGVIVTGYTPNLDNSFTLTSTSFKCSCEHGSDKYGICLPDNDNLIEFGEYKSPEWVCGYGKEIKGIQVKNFKDTLNADLYAGETQSKKLMKKTWTRCSPQNSMQLNYAEIWNNGYINFVKGYTELSECDEPSSHFRIFYEQYSCTCPNGSEKDPQGKFCYPIDCKNGTVEDNNGNCVASQFCPDGGLMVNGGCDRSCESIGMTSINTTINTIVDNPNLQKICVPKVNCLEVAQQCISKCGGKQNVLKSPSCTDTLGVSGSCECKPEEPPQNCDEVAQQCIDKCGGDIKNVINSPSCVDGIVSGNCECKDGTEVVPDTDSKELVTLLQNSNDLLGENNSLLAQSNQNDNTREQQLNSIDGKLTTLDNSIGHLQDGITNLNMDLNNGLGQLDGSIKNLNNDMNMNLAETNEHLRNIKETNQNVSDFIDDIKNADSESFTDNIGDNLSILDDVLDEYGTFKDNLTEQYESIVNLGNEANTTLNSGEMVSIFSNHVSKVTECKQSFTVDFSSLGASSYVIDVDPCSITSMLRPILYPIFYIIFTIGVFSFAFSLFRGVL